MIIPMLLQSTSLSSSPIVCAYVFMVSFEQVMLLSELKSHVHVYTYLYMLLLLLCAGKDAKDVRH